MRKCNNERLEFTQLGNRSSTRNVLIRELSTCAHNHTRHFCSRKIRNHYSTVAMSPYPKSKELSEPTQYDARQTRLSIGVGRNERDKCLSSRHECGCECVHASKIALLYMYCALQLSDLLWLLCCYRFCPRKPKLVSYALSESSVWKDLQVPWEVDIESILDCG